METTRKGAFFRLALILALAGAGLLLLLASLVHHEQHVGLGGEIVHDDFGFRVEHVETEHAFPAAAPRPSGRYLVIHLAITNHAKRVPFALTTWTPVLVDGAGHVIEPHPGAQAALVSELGEAAEFTGSVERGASTTKLVAYDVPENAVDLRLEIHWGGELVNLFEDLVFGAKDIALREVATVEEPRESAATGVPRD